MEDLAAEIRAEVARRRCTYGEAAEMLGVSRSTFFRWTTGQLLAFLKPREVRALSEFLRVYDSAIIDCCIDLANKYHPKKKERSNVANP